MAEITEKEINAIHETHDKVIRIETILDNGLIDEVENQGKQIRRVELIIALFIGSGVLGGGAFGLFKLLLG